MAQPLPSSLHEFSLLRKEIEALGDQLSDESLERKAQVDRLELEIEALKAAIQALYPDFATQFREKYVKILQEFDPEIRRQTKKTA